MRHAWGFRSALLIAFIAALAACSSGNSSGGPAGSRPTAVVTTPGGIQIGDVTISYSLSDPESDTLSITVAYSTDGGASFSPATAGAGGDPTTGLASDPGGLAYTFVWDSVADGVGVAAVNSTVQIRITPSDAAAGTAGTTASFTVDNVSPPTVVVTTPTGTQISYVPIVFTLSDAESDIASITVEYSPDGGTNFAPATPAPGSAPTAGLATSPGGITYTFWWDSRQDGVGFGSPNLTVMIRITPADAAVGVPDTTGNFTVDNTINPTTFRINSLFLRDPHVFVQIPFVGTCVDGTDTSVAGVDSVNTQINNAVTMDLNADTYLDLSILMVFRPFDQAATGGRLDVGPGICTAPLPTTVCDLDPGNPPAISNYTNVAAGTGLQAVPGTTSGYNPPVPTVTGPCFVSDPLTMTVDILGTPVTFQAAQIAAEYTGNPSTTVAPGLLMGFISEADANATMVPLPAPFPPNTVLSDLLPGGAGNCAAGDDRDLGPGGVTGWWFYFEFTADQVTYVGP